MRRKSVEAVAVLGLSLLYAPLAALVASSFGWPRESWTLRWYERAFANPEILEAVARSLWIAAVAAAGSMAIGACAAYALDRARIRAEGLFLVLTWVPFVMPEIVLGLSLLVWFVVLRVSLGTFSIVLAHITFTVSYVILTVGARLRAFDPAIEEAARDLGASGWQVFRRVTFPLMAPGILAGGALAFVLSFDDFLISFFTAGVGSDTLPVKIYSMIRFGVSPEISALSTVLLGATLAAVALMGAKARPL